MARRYHLPTCVAFAPDDSGRVCGVRMTYMGERDPAFGPNWRPGHHLFKCPWCGAVRALSAEHLDRYARAI